MSNSDTMKDNKFIKDYTYVMAWYISDLHLDIYFKRNNIEYSRREIKRIVTNLCSPIKKSEDYKYDIYVLGDVSGDIRLNSIFFEEMRKQLPDYNIFYVLGNHEMFMFNRYDECMLYYSSMCNMHNILLLENDYIETKGFIICGSHGWFNNINEISSYRGHISSKKISDLSVIWQDKFKYVVSKSKETKRAVICITHVSIEFTGLRATNRTVFFSGHNHSNNITMYSKGGIIFEDNQVSLYNRNSKFKQIKIRA